MEELENAGIPTATEQTVEPEIQKTEPIKTEVKEKVAKSFSQEEVNEIVKERLKNEKSKSITEVCKKYGVDSIEELDKLFENSKLNAKEAKEAKKNLLFRENNISDDRVNDVVAHFNGCGLDFTDENLKESIKTHPEWVKKVATIEQLGNDKREIKKEDDVNTILHDYWGL